MASYNLNNMSNITFKNTSTNQTCPLCKVIYNGTKVWEKHDYSKVISSTSASCATQTDGKTVKECSRCTNRTTITTPWEHNYTWRETLPTFASNGQYGYRCSKCNQWYSGYPQTEAGGKPSLTIGLEWYNTSWANDNGYSEITLNGTTHKDYPKTITITPSNMNSTEETMTFSINAKYTYLSGRVYNPVILYNVNVTYYTDENQPTVSNMSATKEVTGSNNALAWTYYYLSCDVTMTVHPNRAYSITLYPALLAMP